MLFYRVRGIAEDDENSVKQSMSFREKQRKIAVITEEFNSKSLKQAYYFLSDIADSVVTAGIIEEDADGVESRLSGFLTRVGISMNDITVSEVTFSEIEDLLMLASRRGYIDEVDDVMEKFGIDRLTGRRGRGIFFGDNIIKDITKAQIYKSASSYLMNDTLVPELDRIYEETPFSKAYGHPVHYMIETDDGDTLREVTRLLLGALYANHRLNSRRYSRIDFRPGMNFSEMAYDALYKVSFGGTIVVRFFANDNSEDDIFALSSCEMIECICETAKKYRNQVLTVVCLPRECTKTKNLFFLNSDTVSIVELKEEFATGKRAEDFLEMLAENAKIRTDKKLFEKLDRPDGYLASELHNIFDIWYDSKLKTTVFPQYKDIQTVKKDTLKEKPKGTAYDELMEMVGLGEAKQAIIKAVDYYKMQKLFKEKGIVQEHPSMHMIFTGNPGTAKTTVARLFSKIMKENGLLSGGQLVEVGRADLVGRFVGWTAQIVQEKFRLASGGVLFIDEAYALAEAKGGMYGDEAINTIVQEMENHRDEVVVIFAGYPDKMKEFLGKNPGLRSRIAFNIHFDDYDSDELLGIAHLIGKKNGIKLTDGALSKLRDVFDIARKNTDFGNGRYVRNVLEQARMSQAVRLMKTDLDSITEEELVTIEPEDIVIPDEKRVSRKVIGFAS